MGENKEVAFLKRNEINKANQTMFLAVAGAALITGASVVGMIYLFRIFTFNAKVIGEQDKSIKTIEQNIKNIEDLKSKLSTLETDSHLNERQLKSNLEDGGLRVIADALPDRENAAALAASLEKKIFSEGVTLDAFSIDSADSAAASNDNNSSSLTSSSNSTSTSTTSTQTSSPTGVEDRNKIPNDVKDIQFSATISAGFQTEGANASSVSKSQDDALNNLIKTVRKMERSIRAINITSFKFERSTNKFSLNFSAKAYYYPKYVMMLENKKVVADENAKPTKSNSSTNGTQNSSKSGGSK